MKNVLTSIRVVALLGFITLCGAYLAAQGQSITVKPHGPITQAEIAAAMEACTGCLGGQGQKQNCYLCHDFTYRVGMGDCWYCDVPAISRESVKPNFVHPVYLRGVDTGKVMKLAENWTTVEMPSNHRRLAQESRAKVPDCKGNKTVTQ